MNFGCFNLNFTKSSRSVERNTALGKMCDVLVKLVAQLRAKAPPRATRANQKQPSRVVRNWKVCMSLYVHPDKGRFPVGLPALLQTGVNVWSDWMEVNNPSPSMDELESSVVRPLLEAIAEARPPTNEEWEARVAAFNVDMEAYCYAREENLKTRKKRRKQSKGGTSTDSFVVNFVVPSTWTIQSMNRKNQVNYGVVDEQMDLYVFSHLIRRDGMDALSWDRLFLAKETYLNLRLAFRRFIGYAEYILQTIPSIQYVVVLQENQSTEGNALLIEEEGKEEE